MDWLTPDDASVSKSSKASPATLKSPAYRSPQPETGGTPMNDHIAPNSRFPICEHAQRMHDVLLVSSFALWAVLIGFAPVMTYRLLMT
jgi:hypothetical protein